MVSRPPAAPAVDRAKPRGRAKQPVSAVRSGDSPPGCRSDAPGARDPPQARGRPRSTAGESGRYSRLRGPRLSREDRTDAAHRGSPSPTPGGAPHGAPPAPALGRRRRAAPPHAAHAPRPLGAPAPGLRRLCAGPRRARGRRRCQPANREARGTPGLPTNPSGFLERPALGFRRSAGPAPGVPQRAAAAAGEWSARGAGPGLAGWACRPWEAVLRCLATTAGGAAGTRAAPAGGPVQSRGCAGGGRWSPGAARPRPVPSPLQPGAGWLLYPAVPVPAPTACAWTESFYPRSHPMACTVIIPVLPTGKLRHTETRPLPGSHTACE